MFSKLCGALLACALLLAACAAQPTPVTYPEPPSGANSTPSYPMTDGTPSLPISVPQETEDMNWSNPLTGTQNSGVPPEFAPAAGDEKLSQGAVFMEGPEIRNLESFPPQFVLHLQGNLPTPCHQLRVEQGKPDAQGQIAVKVYSVFNPETMCAQVLQPFQADIPLGSLPAGKYTVSINGEKLGEIQAP